MATSNAHGCLGQLAETLIVLLGQAYSIVSTDVAVTVMPFGHKTLEMIGVIGRNVV